MKEKDKKEQPKQEKPKQVIQTSEEIKKELKDAGIELDKWTEPTSYPNDRNMA